MIKKILASSILAMSLFATPALAEEGAGFHIGVGPNGVGVGIGEHHNRWHNGPPHHRGHFYQGRWWGYGEGRCWRHVGPEEWVWVCGDYDD